MKRVFSAIELPADARSTVEAYARRLAEEYPESKAKWLPADRLHLTVRFFGNVDERALKVINDAHKRLAAVHSRFRIAIDGTGVFPSARRPKVLWLGVSGAEELAGLKVQIDDELASVGFDHEARGFRPHLTIARLKDPPKARELARRHLSQKFEPVVFSAARIVVLESVQKPTGPEYSLIESAELIA
ncbi:MAG TPA: RNA 2',3'-cyclic phosphodiesterase [Aridibacter sp.]|nr:RNA 2',3'-cyclic phosphodiesterase [Aridibacter sp.]